MHTYHHQPFPSPDAELTPSQRHRLLRGQPVYRHETRLERLERLSSRTIGEAASLETARNLLLGRHPRDFIGTAFFNTLMSRMHFQHARYTRLRAVRDAEQARVAAATAAGLCHNCGAPKHQRGESCPFYATPVTFETTPED